MLLGLPLLGLSYLCPIGTNTSVCFRLQYLVPYSANNTPSTYLHMYEQRDQGYIQCRNCNTVVGILSFQSQSRIDCVDTKEGDGVDYR